jgi:hypothetical protein
MYVVLVGLLAAVSAVIITSRGQNPNSGSFNQALAPVDHEKLVRDYKRGAQAAIAEYAGLKVRGDFTFDEIEKVKKELLALKVPAEFKELHVQLVLALTKIEDSLGSGGSAASEEGQNKIEQAKASYSWLE